jgi:UDPglucose--hexose-1-phosphate uridylyltransferase
VKITHATLSDGREIVYYDDADGARREVHDPRDLPRTSTTSQIRYDRTLDEWVAIAAHRTDRTYLPPADECPLCPSRGGRQTEIPSDDYDVVVFENRFPTFATLPEDAAPAPYPIGSPWTERPGAGRCEVVCFTADHDSHFSALAPARVRTVVEAWVDRTLALSRLPSVEQVFCFENRGREIGVTLAHPHGQIYGYPFVTPRTERMLRAARRHREQTGRNLFADLLAAEHHDGARIVARTDCWTAFVPFAARWPIEVHLYPNRQVADLPDLTDGERDDFCGVYLDVLRRMEALYDDTVPYIAGWHQSPVRADRDLGYLHLELLSIRRAPGKLKYLAGSESAMGAWVNDVTPEASAAMLRGVAP